MKEPIQVKEAVEFQGEEFGRITDPAPQLHLRVGFLTMPEVPDDLSVEDCHSWFAQEVTEKVFASFVNGLRQDCESLLEVASIAKEERDMFSMLAEIAVAEIAANTYWHDILEYHDGERKSAVDCMEEKITPEAAADLLARLRNVAGIESKVVIKLAGNELLIEQHLNNEFPSFMDKWQKAGNDEGVIDAVCGKGLSFIKQAFKKAEMPEPDLIRFIAEIPQD